MLVCVKIKKNIYFASNSLTGPGLQHHQDGTLGAEAEGAGLREDHGGTWPTAIGLKTSGWSSTAINIAIDLHFKL